MSKSLRNNAGGGGKGCCASKSLLNLEATGTGTGQVVENVTTIINAPSTGGGGGGGNGEIPDPLVVDNLSVLELLQAKDANIVGTLTINNGELLFQNNTISGTGDIIILCEDPTDEFLVQCNFKVTGGYSRLESRETSISDRVPTIGYIPTGVIPALDNDDRGFEFLYTVDTGGNVAVNRGFMGYNLYDKNLNPKNRFVFWGNAQLIPGVSGTDQNYERQGLTKNEAELDIIYTTLITNPDFKIGGVDEFDIQILVRDELYMKSNFENHEANDVTYTVKDEEIHIVGVNSFGTGRFRVAAGFKSACNKIELNNKGANKGLLLYHPTLVDIETCDPGGEVNIGATDINLNSSDDIILTAGGTVIFNTVDPIIFNDPVVFNAKITSKNLNNDVAANCIIFNGPGPSFPKISRPTTSASAATRPLGNAGVLYYDNGINAIKGVTDTAAPFDILQYDGTNVVWISPASLGAINLQTAYTNSFPAQIVLNNASNGIIIRDAVPTVLNNILFEVTSDTDYPGPFGPDFKLFSVNSRIAVNSGGNRRATRNINFGGNINMNASYKIIGTPPSPSSRIVSGMVTNTMGIEFYSYDNSQYYSNGSDTSSVPFGPPSNPSDDVPGSTPNRTLWYHGIEERLKMGDSGDDYPVALAPNTTGGANQLVKIPSGLPFESHRLDVTGVTSPASGELTVPGKLIATSQTNDVTADRLTFDNAGPVQTLATPAPIGPGGVLYYNGTNIIGVTDMAVSGDVLTYDGMAGVVWAPPAGDLQAAYDNSTGGMAVIEVNSTEGKILIKDNDNEVDAIDGVIFQVTTKTELTDAFGTDFNLFSISSDLSNNGKNIKVGGNLSMEGDINILKGATGTTGPAGPSGPTGPSVVLIQGVICQTTGIEYYPIDQVDCISLIPMMPPTVVTIPITPFNPSDLLADAESDRTVWYDGAEERLKVGNAGSNLPFALAPPDNGGFGSNQLVKVASALDEETHVLTFTGVSSPSSGNLCGQGFKFSGLGMVAPDAAVVPNSQGEGTVWTMDGGVSCPSRPIFSDYDPSAATSTDYEIALTTANQALSNKIYHDNYQKLNMDHTTGGTTETGGVVVNYLPIVGQQDTITGFNTVSTVAKSGLVMFSPGDIILITGACPDNNNLYQVAGDSGSVLSVNPLPSEPFLKSTFTIDPVSTGLITHVNVSTIRTDLNGDWIIGKGNAVPLTYNKLTNRVTYNLLSNVTAVTFVAWNTIAYLPWDNARYGTGGLGYKNGVLIFYQIDGVAPSFTIDIRVVDSTGGTVYGQLLGSAGNGIKNVLLNLVPLPIADDFFQIQVQQSGIGPNIPNVLSCTLEFDY